MKRWKAHAWTFAMAVVFAALAYGAVHALIRVQRLLWP